MHRPIETMQTKSVSSLGVIKIIWMQGIDKANAIDVLLEHLNAKKADTIAFGDAKVDIPMFEYCEQSVCLGNGGDEAKKAADMVTQAVDDDGLASAFYKLGLI